MNIISQTPSTRYHPDPDSCNQRKGCRTSCHLQAATWQRRICQI